MKFKGGEQLNSLLDVVNDTTASEGTGVALRLLGSGPWHLLLTENDTSVLITSPRLCSISEASQGNQQVHEFH